MASSFTLTKSNNRRRRKRHFQYNHTNKNTTTNHFDDENKSDDEEEDFKNTADEVALILHENLSQPQDVADDDVAVDFDKEEKEEVKISKDTSSKKGKPLKKRNHSSSTAPIPTFKSSFRKTTRASCRSRRSNRYDSDDDDDDDDNQEEGRVSLAALTNVIVKEVKTKGDEDDDAGATKQTKKESKKDISTTPLKKKLREEKDNNKPKSTAKKKTDTIGIASSSGSPWSEKEENEKMPPKKKNKESVKTKPRRCHRRSRTRYDSDDDSDGDNYDNNYHKKDEKSTNRDDTVGLTTPTKTKKNDTSYSKNKNDSGDDEDEDATVVFSQESLSNSPTPSNNNNKLEVTFEMDSPSFSPPLKKSRSRIKEEKENDDEEDNDDIIMVGTADEVIENITKNGEINQVVGSQSLLSQELLVKTEIEEGDDDDEEEEEEREEEEKAMGDVTEVVGSQSLLSQELLRSGSIMMKIAGHDDEKDDSSIRKENKNTRVKKEEIGLNDSIDNKSGVKLQRMHTQSDENIKQLDENGELQQVVGSQSILSQELKLLEEEEEDAVATATNHHQNNVKNEEDGDLLFATEELDDDDAEEVEEEEGEDKEDEITNSQISRLGHLLSSDREITLSQDEKSVIDAAQALAGLEGDENLIIEPADVCAPNHPQSFLICQENIDDENAKVQDRHNIHSEMHSGNKLKRSQPIVSPTRRSSRRVKMRVSDRTNNLSYEDDASSPQSHVRDNSHLPQLSDGQGNRIRSDSRYVSSPPDQNEATPSSPQAPSSRAKSNKGSGLAVSKESKSSAPRRRTKSEREAERAKANSIATRAATLAAQTISSPEVAKQLLLSMALVRTNPRSQPSTFPPRGTLIPHGFFWGQYPPLEAVLRSHMQEYYDLSTNKCQSRDQQAFNNKLVTLVREEARRRGWDFDGSVFDDKKIRDRIRCFFKTHIQNAKKRLKTMVKNPTKRANAKALAAHMDLIERYNNKKKRQKSQPFSKKERTYSEEMEGGSEHEYLSDTVSHDDDSHSDNEGLDNARKGLKRADKYSDKENGHSLPHAHETKEDTASDDNASSLQVKEEDDDDDMTQAAQQVMALGFSRLSQDTQVGA